MQNFARAFSRCRGFFHMRMLAPLGISFLLLLPLLLLLLLSQPTSWTPPPPPWRPRRGARNWSLNRGSNPQPLDFQSGISTILSPVSSPLNHAISPGYLGPDESRECLQRSPSRERIQREKQIKHGCFFTASLHAHGPNKNLGRATLNSKRAVTSNPAIYRVQTKHCKYSQAIDGVRDGGG